MTLEYSTVLYHIMHWPRRQRKIKIKIFEKIIRFLYVEYLLYLVAFLCKKILAPAPLTAQPGLYQHLRYTTVAHRKARYKH